MGKVPYEEYIPNIEELNMLRAKNVRIYETYWEMMRHFRILADISGTRGHGVDHNVWASYLF